MADRPHILVAEDEPLSQDLLARRLIAAGYETSVVNDGVACLAWLESRQCDCVLLDVIMPRLGGIDTLRAIRQRFSHDSLPVIVVSALVDSEDVIAGLDAGANDYVVKPVNFRVLEARLQGCLKMRTTVSLLVEAERQRVMIETLGRTAARLGQPLRQVIDVLERASHNALTDDETQRDLAQVTSTVEELVVAIESLKAAGQANNLPYAKRLELLDEDDAAK